jgi:hypothetical protein
VSTVRHSSRLNVMEPSPPEPEPEPETEPETELSRSLADHAQLAAAAAAAAATSAATAPLELWELLAGREAALLLAEFLQGGAAAGDGGAGPSELLLPPGASRGQRKRQHALLRAHFPTVFSETDNQRVRIRRVVQAPMKCVAVDLDNTLWPGVLLEGLGAWHTAAGMPLYHLQLQHELLRLHARGVLMVSCSRNDEDPVLAAWPPPDVCPLQPDHFVCHRFGWGAKSARLVEFANTIGLAHQGLLFIDDMPSERAEVEAASPEIRVVGGDMTAAVEILRAEAYRIGANQLTSDAASRTEKTRAVLARAAAAAEHSSHTSTHSVGGDKTRRRAARSAGAAERAPGAECSFFHRGGLAAVKHQQADTVNGTGCRCWRWQPGRISCLVLANARSEAKTSVLSQQQRLRHEPSCRTRSPNNTIQYGITPAAGAGTHITRPTSSQRWRGARVYCPGFAR